MIKLIDLLKEVLDSRFIELDSSVVDGVKFYHGTIGYEIKNAKDLDPLFRETDVYKRNQEDDYATTRRHGSSRGGVGIYFGRNSDKVGAEDALAYSGLGNSAMPYQTSGYMYEMTLKPNTKVAYYKEGFQKIYRQEYEEMRKQGIDAVTEKRDGSGALNLINPDVISSWRLLDSWRNPFRVILFKYNENTSSEVKVEEKEFMNFKELKDYIKDKLGDTKQAANGGEAYIDPKDPDNLYSIRILRSKPK
jgi:hypothetical protein